MNEARAIQRRIARLMTFAASLDLLGDHDAACLIRARARLWYRTWKVIT